MSRRMQGGTMVFAGVCAGLAVIDIRNWVYPVMGRDTNAAPSALLVVALGWVLASLVAGFVVGRWSQEAPRALLTGTVLMAVPLFDMIAYRHPVWLWPVWLLAFAPCASLGGRLGQRFVPR